MDIPVNKKYPISEIFGPTIQGEGPMAGSRTFFVRFAGCDYDCSWCDTKYAVNPKYPGWQRTMMTSTDILADLMSRGFNPRSPIPDSVTFSGGNPMLFLDEELLGTFLQFVTCVETQGSVFFDRSPDYGKGGLLRLIDVLVISPKPPSSGMASKVNVELLIDTIQLRSENPFMPVTDATALKFVAFDREDLEWAKDIDTRVRAGLSENAQKYLKTYLSVGTAQGQDIETSREQILDGYRMICEFVSEVPGFEHFSVLPQLHVLAWGQKRGV